MHTRLKHFLKKHFLHFKIKNRFSKKETERQFQLIEQYKIAKSKNALPNFSETGFKVFSQFEEDGLLLYVISLIENPVKLFLEFGSDDGVNSNSANLHFHHDWTGLFLDGNEKAIERGRFFYKKWGNKKVKQPTFIHSMITRENINELITKGGLSGEIGVLSIDIDGNDYWVWEAINVINPQIVIIETHNEFGLNDIVVPYDASYFYPGKHPDYHGASPIAMNNLAKHKNYRLVGSNELGFNFIFVRNDLAPELKEVSVESVLEHPSNKEAVKQFEAIKDWEYTWNRTF
jgi:hypothetical protein